MRQFRRLPRAAVVFQAELIFSGCRRSLDPLAHPGQVPEAAPFVSPVRAAQQHLDLVGGVALHLPPGQALVPRARSSGPAAPGVAGMTQQLGDLAFAELGSAMYQATGILSGW
jgi:hypothetical protein